MVKFKGRLFFKQYLLSMPSSKWGIKIWFLCDSHTGYLLRFQVYTGKETQAVLEEGLGYRVATTSLHGFENKEHVIFMDNFYSSVHLYDRLRLQKVSACGTVCVNRKGLPREIKTLKMKRGDLPVTWIYEDKTMFAGSGGTVKERHKACKKKAVQFVYIINSRIGLINLTSCVPHIHLLRNIKSGIRPCGIL